MRAMKRTLELAVKENVNDGAGALVPKTVFYKVSGYQQQVYESSQIQAMANGYSITARFMVRMPREIDTGAIMYAKFRGRKFKVGTITENVGTRYWTLTLREII